MLAFLHFPEYSSHLPNVQNKRKCQRIEGSEIFSEEETGGLHEYQGTPLTPHIFEFGKISSLVPFLRTFQSVGVTICESG